MRAHEFVERLNVAMRENGYGGKDAMVLIDGSVLPISDVRWHDGYEVFAIEVDLT